MSTTHDFQPGPDSGQDPRHGLGLGIPSPRGPLPGAKKRKGRGRLIVFVLPTIILLLICGVGALLFLGGSTNAANPPAFEPGVNTVPQNSAPSIMIRPQPRSTLFPYTPPPDNPGPPGEAELTARLDAWWGAYIGLMGQGSYGSLAHGALEPPMLSDTTEGWIGWLNSVTNATSSIPAQNEGWPSYGQSVFASATVADPAGPLRFINTADGACAPLYGDGNSGLGLGGTASGTTGNTTRFFHGKVMICTPDGRTSKMMLLKLTFHTDPAFGEPGQGIPVVKVCPSSKEKC